MTPARIAELRRYSAEVYVPFLVECLNEIERLTGAVALERRVIEAALACHPYYYPVDKIALDEAVSALKRTKGTP